MTYDDLSNSGFLKAARAAELRQRRLIAAAPDLLAACKWMVEQETNGDGDEMVQAVGAAMRAIAKAESTS